MNLKKNTDAPKKVFWKKDSQEKRINKNERHIHSPLLTKIIVILSLILAICIVGFVFYQKVSNPIIEKRSMIVGEQLSYCQELITLKYRYSDMVTVRPTSKFSESVLFKSFVIVKYEGIIRIGIADVTMIDYEVFNHGKSVRIILPAPEVLGNDISSLSVFDENRSIFIKLTDEEVSEKIDERRQERLDEILADNKLIDEAAEYAKKIITLSMKSCGFEEIYVIGGDH